MELPQLSTKPNQREIPDLLERRYIATFRKLIFGRVCTTSDHSAFLSMLANWSIAAISFLALVATICAAIFTFKQIDIAREQVRASLEATYAACVGTQISRAALVEAIAQGHTARSAMTASTLQTVIAATSEAAHIVPYIDPKPYTGGEYLVPFGVKNDGKTAARKVMTQGRVIFADDAFKFDFTYPIRESFEAQTAFLPAGKEPDSIKGRSLKFVDRSGAPHPLTREDIQQINAGKKYFLVYIRVTYKDLFGIAHWTNFCRAFREGSIPLEKTDAAGDCVDYNGEDHNTILTTTPSIPERAEATIPEISCPVPESLRR